MSDAADSVSIHDLLRWAGERIDRSVGITNAAERQAEQGNVEKAVTTLLGVEQQLYEAATLINAASLINRISSS